MPGFTDTLEQSLLDYTTGKAAYTPPTWYVGVSTSTPTDAGANFTEPTGNNYARVALTASSWNAATPGAPSSSSYGAAVEFARSAGTWGVVSHVGLFSTPTGGSPAMWGTLSEALSIFTGDAPLFSAQGLRIRLGDVPDFGGVAFSPTDITGLVAWYDASNAASITASSGRVSQWNDLAGGHHLTQATGNMQPSWGAEGTNRTQNGLTVVDFYIATVNSRLVASGVDIASPQTMFAVVLADTTGDRTARYFDSYDGSHGSRPFLYLANTNDDWQLVDSSAADTGSVCSTATPYLHAVTWNGASTIFRVNGATVGTTWNTGTGNTLYTICLGCDSVFVTDYWDGWIAEVIFYDSALGSTDVEAVEAYLNTKWAIF